MGFLSLAYGVFEEVKLGPVHPDLVDPVQRIEDEVFAAG